MCSRATRRFTPERMSVLPRRPAWPWRRTSGSRAVCRLLRPMWDSGRPAVPSRTTRRWSSCWKPKSETWRTNWLARDKPEEWTPVRQVSPFLLRHMLLHHILIRWPEFGALPALYLHFAYKILVNVISPTWCNNKCIKHIKPSSLSDTIFSYMILSHTHPIRVNMQLSWSLRCFFLYIYLYHQMIIDVVCALLSLCCCNYNSSHHDSAGDIRLSPCSTERMQTAVWGASSRSSVRHLICRDLSGDCSAAALRGLGGPDPIGRDRCT